MTKHKWHDVLIAIAEGRDTEFLINGEWFTASIKDSLTNPLTHDFYEWRIKKEPVIEVKYFEFVGGFKYLRVIPDLTPWHLKITYQDGKAIKAELPE